MKLFLVLVFIFTSNPSIAAKSALVKFVKGKATKLLPGKQHAAKLKKGDRIPEDTSIVTGRRSFVKIVFNDKTTLNISPNSKVVVSKIPADKASMVNLLTGVIKAQVKKNIKKKTKTKLLVKTRTAVMGVRGTKFQSTYNPVNKNTSLVTVEGKVKMVRLQNHADASKINIPKKDDLTKKVKKISKPEQVVKLDDIDSLDNLIDTSDSAVEVPAGRYSGVVGEIAKPTVPVKIAPQQYNALAKSMNSTKTAEDVMKVSDTDPAPEGFENKQTGDIAPKAGGFVDFTTGIYVAPTAKAVLDKKTGTFEDKNIGKVDRITGDYIPPKGVKVHPKRGFIIDRKLVAKLASNEDKAKVLKTVAMLNQEVDKQIYEEKPKVEAKPESKEPSKWWPKNHMLALKFMPYSDDYTVKNKIDGSKKDFNSEGAAWIIFSWMHEWNETWSSRIRIGGQRYDINDSDLMNVYKYGENEDEFFSLGVAYRLNNRFKFLFDLTGRSEYYVLPQGLPGDVSLEVNHVSSLDLGADILIKQYEKVRLSFLATLSLIGKQEIPGIPDPSCMDFCDNREEGELSGLNLSFNLDYWWRKNLGLNTSLFYNHNSAEGETIEHTRNAVGLGLDFVWDV